MKYIISAGSNLSLSSQTPELQVKYARELLNNAFGDVVSSRLYANPAYPADSGPDFVNAAFCVDAQIPPLEMLDFLHSIEVAMGRERKLRWGPRTIDLDLLAAEKKIFPDMESFAYWRDLAFEDQLRETPNTLILPHPRLQDRPFVLLPMRDIVPNWQHPVSGLSVDQMCDQLSAAQLETCTCIHDGDLPQEST